MPDRERTLVSMPAHFLHFVATGFSFAWFFYGLAAFCLLQAHRAARVEAALRAGVWIAFGLFVAAYATVLMPRREVAHYLHLLVVPGCVLGGLILGASLTAADLGRREAARVIASFLLLAVLPQVHFRWISWHPDLGKLTPICPCRRPRQRRLSVNVRRRRYPCHVGLGAVAPCRNRIAARHP